MVYEAEPGIIEKVRQNGVLSFNTDLEVRRITVGEDGQWVVVTYDNLTKSSEVSFMIPCERVVRLGGPDEIS